MHTDSSKFHSPVTRHALRAVMIVAIVGSMAACDKHSAQDAPEDYGHGSSHNRAEADHKIDSRNGSQHFSDTAGTKDETKEGGEGAHEKHEGTPAPAASPKVL